MKKLLLLLLFVGGTTFGQALPRPATASTPSDTAYDATSWNGVTTIAPSKNAVRDEVETVVADVALKQTEAQVQALIDANGVIGTAIFDASAGPITSPYVTGIITDVTYVSPGIYTVTLSAIQPDENFTVLVSVSGAGSGHLFFLDVYKADADENNNFTVFCYDVGLDIAHNSFSFTGYDPVGKYEVVVVRK
jgi:hypothetical protein